MAIPHSLQWEIDRIPRNRKITHGTGLSWFAVDGIEPGAAVFPSTMLTKPSEITDEGIPQDRMLTKEESREMNENLARDYFGMSLDEFTKAWKASKFDDDQERHGDVIFLATMLPEAWVD